MTTKSVLAIPYWLQEKLQRHQLPLTSILSLNKLSEVLCVEELAAILALNSKVRNTELFGTDHSRELFDLWDTWRQQEHQNFGVIESISYNERTEQELVDRLGVENELDESDPNKGTIYKLVDCERAYCVMVVYPGFFESIALPRFQYSLLKRLLEIFYVYFGATKCFELPLFGNYIRLLSRLSKA